MYIFVRKYIDMNLKFVSFHFYVDTRVLAGMRVLALLFPVITLNTCDRGDDFFPPAPVSFTTLVYMAADNDMDSQVDYTLDQLKAGARRSAGTVAVYLDRNNEPPRLFRITQSGEEMLLKTYEEGNSADAATLAGVIEETKSKLPAERFGLVLWSHGMGWLPYGHSPVRAAALRQGSTFPQTRYICLDQDDGMNTSPRVMEIDALAQALPDYAAEYIWFDACLMGSVETLYELRRKCRYFVASPTNVLAEAGYDASGIPYSKVLPYLFGGKDELVKACGYYMEHYRSRKYSILRSASITLVEAGQLDSLYRTVKTLLNGRLSSSENLDKSGIQVYHTDNEPAVFFDMGDIVKKAGSDNPAAYESFENQLSRTVLYKDVTEKIIDKPVIKSGQHSGLSMYIPHADWKNTNEYRYYFEKMEWAGVYY
jgi:hypothetical protein